MVKMVKGSLVRRSVIHTVLAWCLAWVSPMVFAMELGPVKLISNLGEPLQAEIAFSAVTPEELATLVASIASETEYSARGMSRPATHEDIQLQLSKGLDGAPILKLSSGQAMQDSLDILVQVNWASGQLQREYVLLLDPASNVSMDVVVPSVPVNPPLVVKEEDAVAQSVMPVTVPDKTTEPVVMPDFTVHVGDTLYSIARQVSIEGVGLEQVVAALYTHNPEAFLGNNIHHLEIGSTLKVPSKEAMLALSPQQAQRLVQEHATPENVQVQETKEQPASVEKIEHQAVANQVVTTESKISQDVVKVSTGEKGATVGDVDARIMALQEKATAHEKALKEVQDRAVALEKQIQAMQKLLNLRSQSMSNLQNNAMHADGSMGKMQDWFKGVGPFVVVIFVLLGWLGLRLRTVRKNRADALLNTGTPDITEAQKFDLSSINLNFNVAEDILIKLDLAASYIDMGDKEGARKLLLEVAQQGDESQQLQAQKMLSELRKH